MMGVVSPLKGLVRRQVDVLEVVVSGCHLSLGISHLAEKLKEEFGRKCFDEKLGWSESSLRRDRREHSSSSSFSS